MNFDPKRSDLPDAGLAHRAAALALAIIVTAALALSAGAGCRKNPPASPDTVAINGHTWQVELAVTEPQQHEGLAGRKSIDPGRGMLFLYAGAQPREFWMKDCEMTIDIAFIGADHKVTSTYTMSPEPGKPDDELMVYRSGSPSQFALEVGGGELKRAGVQAGQQVEISAGVEQRAKIP